jgi:hypothetical protein
MPYGLYLVGDNSNLQIDSAQPYSFLKVVETGSATTVTRNTTTEMIFVKPPSAGSLAVGYAGTAPNYSFYDELHQSVTLDYVKVRYTKADTASTSGYGLQVYNNFGELAFDTGVFINATAGNNFLQIVKVISVGQPTIYGDPTLNSSIVYTGSDYLSIYMNITGSWFNTADLNLMGYEWNSATTTIRLLSTRTVTSGPGGGVPTTSYFNASQGIMCARII